MQLRHYWKKPYEKTATEKLLYRLPLHCVSLQNSCRMMQSLVTSTLIGIPIMYIMCFENIICVRMQGNLWPINADSQCKLTLLLEIQ